jgi:membrane-associated protease RseP (regulator of RpoE activity)
MAEHFPDFFGHIVNIYNYLVEEKDMKKELLFLASISVSSLLAMTATAKNINKNTDNNPNINQTMTKQQVKWLGVSLENLTDALKAQLSKQIDGNSGVMINNVQNNSPAQKAGIQAYDILTSINGEKVSSAEQVYQLVQQADGNKEIPLEIIRQGEKKKLNATIGTREITQNPQPLNPAFNNFNGFGDNFRNSTPNWNSPFFQPQWPGFSMPQLPALPKDFSGKTRSWSQSESLSVKTLKDGKLHAELKSKDKDNNEKNYVFEGTREAVIQQIQKEKDMPQQYKDQLLGAVQGNPSIHFNSGVFSNNVQPAFPGFPFSNPWLNIPQQNRPTY